MARRRVQPPESPPGPQAYRQAVEDLLAVHDAHRSVRVGHSKARDLTGLHGLVAHTLEQVRAALALLDAGHGFAAQVNARVAYEHALVLQWVHLTGEGMDKFIAHGQKKTQTLLHGAVKAGLDMPSDLKAALDGGPAGPPEPLLKNFEQLCSAFDPTGWTYLVFRQLSSTVHPTPGTALAYLDVGQDPPGLLQQATLRDDRPLLWTLAMAAALAVAVNEDLRRGKPNKAKVRDIATAVGLPTLLNPPAAGQSARRRSELPAPTPRSPAGRAVYGRDPDPEPSRDEDV
jgi:hypothetical protein